LSVGLLIGAAALAQPAAPLRTARVTGRVVKPNGDPLRRATVTLLGTENYTVNADANGAFALDNIAPGAYALIAQRMGYASQKYGAAGPLVRSCSGLDNAGLQTARAAGGPDPISRFRPCIERAPGTMLSLTAGSEMKDLIIRVTQHGLISGKVLNQDGEPVPGVVMAMKAGYERGARRLVIETSSAIGPDGEYTVDDLPPGPYYLRAMSGSMMAINGSATIITGSTMIITGMASSLDRPGKTAPEADVATYYPSELDETKAASVEVKPGEEAAGVDVLLRRTRVFSVRGTVSAPPGGGAGTAMVTLAPKGALSEPFNSARGVVAANGAFEIRNVDPGTYVISCTRQGATPTLYLRQDVVVSAADVEGVNLTPVQGVAVTGTVKVEGVNSGTWPNLTLMAPDGGFGSGSATFDSKGAFTFRMPVAPLEYEVRLGALPPGTYVKSIRYGNRDALHGLLDLTGGAAGSLDIVLSSRVAALTGKVKNATDGAAAGVLVTAWPRKAEAEGGVHSASTDQNGAFKIADLGPGDYFVAAWEDIDPGLADSPEFLGRFRNDATAVAIEEGGRASADLKLIPRQRIDPEVAKLP